MKIENIADKAGIFLSFACIIHCLAIAIIPSFFPLLLVNDSHDFHIIVLIAFLIIASLSFVPSYKNHGQTIVIKISGVGFVMTLVGLIIEVTHMIHAHEVSHYLSIIGSFLIVVAHARNIHLSHTNKHQCC